jgi:hypothetical protein
MPRRLAAVAVAAVLVLAGCSSGGDDESSEGPEPTTETTAPAEGAGDDGAAALDSEVPDLCTLFTAEDFLALTGEVAAAPESDAGVGAIRGTCTINAEAGFPLVLLGAYDESDREATLAMVDAEPVDALGVDAQWDDTVGLVVPLEGRDWYLQVVVRDGGPDQAASIQVAELVLERLAG